MKGDNGPKRALNLITGQVVHIAQEQIIKDKVPILKTLTQNTLNTIAYQNNVPKKKMNGDSFCVSETGADYYYHAYNEAMLKCSNERQRKPLDELNTTLVEDLGRHLPHWTPSTGDKIVYTTVEAGSANVNDVGNKLKSDLNIEKKRVFHRKYY